MRQELKVLEITDHPHITKVYELLEDHDHIYAVMELLDGGNLLDKTTCIEKLSE